MDYGLFGTSHAKNEKCVQNEVAESVRPKADIKDDPEQYPGLLEDIVQVYKGDSKGRENITQVAAQIDMDASGEVNMEASISSDDVIRAGGFGARDDLSSFLPVASDSTHCEASLRDARDYEDPQRDMQTRSWLDRSCNVRLVVLLIHIKFL